MPKETMTSKERWLAVLMREKPDRVPMDYWATGEASEKLVRHLGARDLAEALATLHVDTPVNLGGRYVGPKLPKGTDVFGMRHRTVDYGTGTYAEVANAPLADYDSPDEIEAGYTWPSPDWWDYSHLGEAAEKAAERPVRAGG